MKEDRQGIILVVIAMTIFTFQDVLIKLLSDKVSLFQILFFRSLIGIIIIVAYLKVTRQTIKFGSAYPFLSICRGLLFFSGYSFFYFAQSKVPLANATVIFLISPFFITILSIFVFKSQVGLFRWVTMAVGFMGVILISQPKAGDFNLYYLLPVFSALTYSISMMIAKKTADKDTVYQQIIFMYLITVLLCAALGLTIGSGSFDTPEYAAIQFMTRAWRFDDQMMLYGFIGIAIIGTLGFLLLTTAYRMGDPVVIAPFEYSGLVSAIILGYLLWQDVPSYAEAAGMILIVGSGIYLFYRENVRGQQTAAESPLR